MTDRYSEEEALAAIPRLSRTRLAAFVEIGAVVPVHTQGGFVFRQIDLVRMELLCELSEDVGLEEDALAVVISLIDQLHAVRRDLHAIVLAVAREPADVRARIGAALVDRRAPEAGGTG